MRKLIPLLLLFFVVSGFHKSVDNSLKDTLPGTWELRTVNGGSVGVVTNLAPGNDNILSFKSSNQYHFVSISANGATEQNGNYTITEKVVNNRKTGDVYLDNNTSPTYEFTIQNDTLAVLPVIWVDASSSKWVKQ